jgi:hypothetical protein
VKNDAGVGQSTVSVGLYQGANLIASVPTEPDGTYLFLNVAAGAYTVEPAPPPSANLCPLGRDVSLVSGSAIIADFTVSATPCQIDVLVLSGGDVDDTQTVADMFICTPGVVAETFFYVNRTPGIQALRQYDVVLLFTNGIFDETTRLGNELAQYVQAGGNLVIGTFYWQGRSDSGFGSPGWGALQNLDPLTSNVNPFTGHGGATYQLDSLAFGTVVTHPLTTGLFSLRSLAGYSGGTTAKASATVVASWSNSGPLVAYRVLPSGQRVVAVTLFPAATANQADGAVQTLWENAVTWAGVAGGPAP